MRTNAEIEVIGYVYQDAKCPDEINFPFWVTFKLAVNKKYKDKIGQEKQETTWFECKSTQENLSKIIKSYVKDKMGVLVKGIPKAKAYINKDGVAEANILISITSLNMLTSHKDTDSKHFTEKKIIEDYSDIPF